MDLGCFGEKKKKKIYLTLLSQRKKNAETQYLSPFNHCMTTTEKLKFCQKYSKTVMM